MIVAAMYYMMALVLFCGAKMPEKSKDAKGERAKTEFVTQYDKAITLLSKRMNSENGVFKAIPVNAKDFADQAWNAYRDELVIGMSFFEDFIKEPRILKGERRATFGPGLTYVFDVDENGKIEQHKCNGKWADRAAKFTIDDIWNQFRMCCIHNMFAKYGLQKAIKGTDLNGRACIALCFAGYQSPSAMKSIAEEYSGAITMQEKMDAFLAKVPRRTAKGVKISTGSLKRRWWCAAYANGLITSQDLMSVPCASYASIELSKVYKDGHFKYDDETIQYALNKVCDVDRKNINDFLSDFEMGQDIMTRMENEELNIYNVFGKNNVFFVSDNTSVNKKDAFRHGANRIVKNKSKNEILKSLLRDQDKEI